MARRQTYLKAVETPEPTNRRTYWEQEIAKAKQRWDRFYTDGDRIQDRFRLESDRVEAQRYSIEYVGDDKYNILYSSTETIKPSLYAQTPKTQAKVRNVDQQNDTKVYAAMLMEQIGDYGVEVVDFDRVMKNVVSDFVLPGLGVAWVRYDPRFTPANDDGEESYLQFEGVALDYVNYRDFLTGVARFWAEVPWVARKVYMDKAKATKRFGAEKAGYLEYSFNEKSDGRSKASYDVPVTEQAIVYEIWNKETKQVIWYSDDYHDDVLDMREDFLKLERFFPCPEPLRAVWNTKTFIPRGLYSQYKSQAAQLDLITHRIRILTEALKARGLYDGSQPQIANVLNGNGNKMIPVENWAALIQNGGIVGSVQWVPLDTVVQTLSELYKQREIAKNEIYEITGFSDILRGVSKASETLGAQQIKADWGGSRLKDLQYEVQRFCRDLIRIMVEIAVEHFNDKTLMAYSGVSIPQPTPEEAQAAVQALQAGQPAPPTAGQQIQAQVQQVFQLLRTQKLRCANLSIETDSTILPDEEKERQDRLMFLGQIGAFLQQAGPMALQYPDMRGLLGAIMMFAVRTFPQSRPLEKEFESFVMKLQQAPPVDPNQDKNSAAQATLQAAQMKVQGDQQMAAGDQAMKKYQVDQEQATARQKNQQDHEYRMAQLSLEHRKIRLNEITQGAQMQDQVHDHMNTMTDQATTLAKIQADHLRTAADTGFKQAMETWKQDAAERDQAHTHAIESRAQDLAEKAQSAQEALNEQPNAEPKGD